MYDWAGPDLILGTHLISTTGLVHNGEENMWFGSGEFSIF